MRDGRWFLKGRVYVSIGGHFYTWLIEVGRLSVGWERKGEKW